MNVLKLTTRIVTSQASKKNLSEGFRTFSSGQNDSVRDLLKPKPGKPTFPGTDLIDPPVRIFITSSGDEQMVPRFPPPPKQGRLDALQFTKDAFPTFPKVEAVQVGHVVGRGIEQFATALPPCMQDVASGSIGKHYREDVPELMKLPATDQNLALLACVETVHWNQETESSGNKIGSSMSATERFAILKNAQNLNNAPPDKAEGVKASINAILKRENAWEPVANTAGLKSAEKKLFADISSQVAEMAPSFAKNGIVDVKKLGDAVTECSKLSKGDPDKLLAALKQKNSELKEASVGVESASPLKLRSGKTLSEAMGKPQSVELPKLSVGSSNRL